jgi:NAD(P)-dependent dehydrogenase (short-subunit alcohol dehydrogenase family)
VTAKDIDIDEAVWEKSMAVNLEGAMRVARLTIPSMVERAGDLLSSPRPQHRSSPVTLGYQVSKAGCTR